MFTRRGVVVAAASGALLPAAVRARSADHGHGYDHETDEPETVASAAAEGRARDGRPTRYRSVESGEVLQHSNVVYRAWKGGFPLEILDDGWIRLDGEVYEPLTWSVDEG